MRAVYPPAAGTGKSRRFPRVKGRGRGGFGYTGAMSPLLVRSGYGLLLAAYLAYAVFVAPHGDPPGVTFLSLAVGRGPIRNPAVWGVFQLLGVVPLMYWALLFPDGRGQKV